MVFEYVNTIYSRSALDRRLIEQLYDTISTPGRIREISTGRFVSQETFNRAAGVTRYWNRIRAIVSAGEERTFAEARQLLSQFTQEYDSLSAEEYAQWKQDLFGSP